MQNYQWIQDQHKEKTMWMQIPIHILIFFLELGNIQCNRTLRSTYTNNGCNFKNVFQLCHVPGKGQRGFMARKMQTTLKSAAQSQEEESWPNTLPPHWLLMPEEKERFPICHDLRVRKEGRWALGPSCLAEELNCSGIFVLERLIAGILDLPLIDAAEHPKNSGLKLGMAEGNNLLEELTVLSECVSELTLRTDLGDKVKKKVGWKGQKLLRTKNLN